MDAGATTLPASHHRPAAPRLRSWRALAIGGGVALLTAADVGFGTACAAPPRSEHKIAPASIQPELPDKNLSYGLARFEAWAEVKRIATTFESVSITSAPGLNHLAADVRALQRRIEGGGRIELDRIDPQALVTRNRHFWRATLETARGDVLLPIFEALVWLSAGEVVRAHSQLTILRATPQVPEHLDRQLLQHLHNIDRSAPAALTEDFAFAGTSPPGSGRLSRLEHISTRHPGNPVVAHHILVNRLAARGLPDEPSALAEDGAELADVATIVRESVAEVAVLRKQNPVFAALFQPDPDRRRDARQLWQYWGEATRADGAVNNDDLTRIVEGVEQLGLPERALSLSRLITADSDFDAAADHARWERLLPHVIGEDESAPILREAGRRQGAPITFTTATPPGPVRDTPTRPIHPLIAQKAERSLRDASYVIEREGTERDELASAYRRRAYALKSLGRWQEAEADLKRLAAYDTQSEGRAMIRTYLALEHDNPKDAWRAIETLRRHDGSASVVLMLSAATYAREGKWIKAAEAYASAALLPDVDAEQRAYAAFHAAASTRFAGGEATSLLEQALRHSPKHAWVTHLLNALVDAEAARQLLDDAEVGSTVQRVDRRCEAYLALAVRPGLQPEEVKAALINCVETGRVGFIEYDLARARLRELDPLQWGHGRPFVTRQQ